MFTHTADYEGRLQAAQKLFEQFKHSMINQDMDPFIELFDDEVVFEFPYAPDGFTQRLEGKAALYDYVRNLPGQLKLSQFTFIETKDGKIVHYKDYWNPLVVLAALGDEASFPNFSHSDKE